MCTHRIYKKQTKKKKRQKTHNVNNRAVMGTYLNLSPIILLNRIRKKNYYTVNENAKIESTLLQVVCFSVDLFRTAKPFMLVNIMHRTIFFFY